MYHELFLQVLQQLRSAPVTRSGEDFCFSVLDTSQMCHHPIMPQNITKSSFALLLLEENNAENNMTQKNTAYLNANTRKKCTYTGFRKRHPSSLQWLGIGVSKTCTGQEIFDCITFRHHYLTCKFYPSFGGNWDTDH